MLSQDGSELSRGGLPVRGRGQSQPRPQEPHHAPQGQQYQVSEY